MAQTNDRFLLKAYTMNANGDLDEAFEPRPIESEVAAITAATMLIARHDGVVVLKQSVDSAGSEVGPAIIVFQQGTVPELD